jgi:hypothetical protein
MLPIDTSAFRGERSESARKRRRRVRGRLILLADMHHPLAPTLSPQGAGLPRENFPES